MLKQTGVPSADDLKRVSPSEERLALGPVAIIECFQKIPCNPCATSCPQGAIKPFVDINDLPDFDPALCNGCAICVANCPGLAIFVVDERYSEDTALIKLPYEFAPLPEVGAMVGVMNRGGQQIALGKIVRVQNPPRFDRTAVVHVEVPKCWAREVRFLALGANKR
ncbi:MAG: hypothetical protein DDT35_00494 [Firmicutes bacterium]|nr:hypothetical protein [Bacillota bacterium]